MGAVVPGCGTTFGVIADVVAPPLLLLGGGGRPGGGVPVLPGPHDSIIVGEPHVNGLKKSAEIINCAQLIIYFIVQS